MSAIHFAWKATNNDSEYEVLINCLRSDLEVKVANIIVRGDSMLVVY